MQTALHNAQGSENAVETLDEDLEPPHGPRWDSGQNRIEFHTEEKLMRHRTPRQ